MTNRKFRRYIAASLLAMMAATAVLGEPAVALAQETATENSAVDEQNNESEAAGTADDESETAGTEDAGSAEVLRENGKKIVRMGYYENDNFQAGASDDLVKTGYSYEYMRRLEMYTDWDYEYVYGEYGDLYDMLVAGEIDLLTGLAYREDREAILSYPEESMGDTPYSFLKRSKDKDISSKPYTIEGRKIGAVEGAMVSIVEEYLKENRIEAEIVVYNDVKARDQALIDGDVDITIVEGNGTGAQEGIEAFATAGASDYYVVVNKQRPDLLDDLNEGQTRLFAANAKIKTELNARWFKTNAVSATLTETEKEWQATHKSLTVGYFADYLPYSGNDENGNVYGVVKDVVPEIFRVLGIEDIEIDYQGFASYNEMMEALENGDIDTMFPAYTNYWATEQYSIMPTNAAISSYYNLIYAGEYPDMDNAVIALRDTNAMNQSYAAVHYPNAKVKMYDTVKACLDAVVEGKADAMLVNGLRSDYLLRSDDKYLNLHSSQIAAEAPLGFATLSAQPGTVEVINHGLSLMDDDFALTHTYQYEQTHKVTIKEFLQENGWVGNVVIIVIILVILAFVLRELWKNREMLRQEEEQRRVLAEAKEAAEAANNAKSAFLFNMSHDIRTPMNAIMGFRDLLEKHQEEPDKRKYYLRQIEESSTVLLSILNNVLEMARIEKGTLVYDETAWSAEQFNDTLYSVFHEMMAQKGIHFTRTINVEHHYVFCDPTKLREVFLNILSNAYKYTNEGGEVSMTLDELPCEIEGWASYRTTIRDTGIGMSEEFLPHVFEEFSRERNSNTSKIDGTGLGMPIVKKLVDFMNGSIEVESEKGVGTTFTVTLPHRIAAQSDLTQISGVEVDAKIFKGKRILLAEDIAVNAEIAKAILTEVGFTIEVAEDGIVCTEMLSNAPAGYYDVILMDIQMPRMNGYEATRKIRSMENIEKANIPILAMTANAFEEDKREAFRSGMNGHCSKPINIHDLLKELARVLTM